MSVSYIMVRLVQISNESFLLIGESIAESKSRRNTAMKFRLSSATWYRQTLALVRVFTMKQVLVTKKCVPQSVKRYLAIQ